MSELKELIIKRDNLFKEIASRKEELNTVLETIISLCPHNEIIAEEHHDFDRTRVHYNCILCAKKVDLKDSMKIVRRTYYG